MLIDASDDDEDGPDQLDDYASNTIGKTDRTRSLSSSSGNSSIEQDQSLPIDEENRLTRRKHQ